MATYSYTATGSILTGHLTNDIISEGRGTYKYGSQIVSLGWGNAISYIDGIIANYEPVLGGTITYEIGDSYLNVIQSQYYSDITFTWSGITVDPSTNSQGIPSSISLKDEDGQIFTFNWSAVTTVAYTTCESCLDITKSACEASYNFKVGLTANTDYFVVLENSKGKEYSATITSDSIGAITIDATAPEFPEGMFIPESGIYTLRVFADDTKETQELLTFGTTQYYCIQLSFIYSQTFTSDITGVYLLGSGTDSFSIMVDDNGSAISIA